MQDWSLGPGHPKEADAVHGVVKFDHPATPRNHEKRLDQLCRPPFDFSATLLGLMV